MRGISTIIVTILILMISVSLTGLGYITFSNFFSQVTTAGNTAVSQTISTMLAQMRIESMSNAGGVVSVYIRNTGKVDLTNFTAYDDDAAVPTANLQKPTGDKIAPGAVGNLNITGGIVASGSIIKITTAQGTQALQQLP